MKAFWRIFTYIWPQWPRLIVVFSTAIIVAVLLSVSFMTIIPLIKVMLGQEGLHGWIDRKACDWKYGANIYLPDAADVAMDPTLAHSLRVTGIEQGSLAHLAGLQNEDRIVGVGARRPSEDGAKVPAPEILEELAADPDLSRRLARAGRKAALERFTLNRMTDRVERLLETVTAPH